MVTLGSKSRYNNNNEKNTSVLINRSCRLTETLFLLREKKTSDAIGFHMYKYNGRYKCILLITKKYVSKLRWKYDKVARIFKVFPIVEFVHWGIWKTVRSGHCYIQKRITIIIYGGHHIIEWTIHWIIRMLCKLLSSKNNMSLLRYWCWCCCCAGYWNQKRKSTEKENTEYSWVRACEWNNSINLYIYVNEISEQLWTNTHTHTLKLTRYGVLLCISMRFVDWSDDENK